MWIGLAACLGASAVAAGAFGAHGLKAHATADQLAAWSTASQYHLLHSVAILSLALYAAATGRYIQLPASLMAAGVVLFSGSIYLLVLTSLRWLGPVTPLGGLLLIGGWLAVFALVTR
jgi:uncharacterized membrane protein YgdD (TMEM256/DUF423 family)